MPSPLYVTFLWHMHQPDYRDAKGLARLPWTRLHATKDYLHMAELLTAYPQIRCAVNFTPVLLEQLMALGNGTASDRALELSRQTAWSPEDKRQVLETFFEVNQRRIMPNFPRYVELWQRKQSAPIDPERWSDQEVRDLIALYNLALIDSNWLRNDPILRNLVQKGRNYTLAEVEAVLTAQRVIIRKIVPAYRALAERGQVELTTTPYYHPILPLLLDTNSALISMPNAVLPQHRFQHPEDAVAQVQRAIELHEKVFGRRPLGLWPSEGAVGQAIVPILYEAGIRWFATGEGILANSLGVELKRDAQGNRLDVDALYTPYATRLDGTQQGPAIIFRDLELSDLIGFEYQHAQGSAGAEDLIRRLHVIHERTAQSDQAHLVSIILDGENAWEAYEDNGNPFFHALYTALSDDPALQTITPSEYLQKFPPQQSIPHLYTGSWIRSSLDTWIGEPAQARAWEILWQTRADLVAYQEKNPQSDPEQLAAWRAIYIAEGSDWFWWAFSGNPSPYAAQFDQIFRKHLAEVYRLIGQPRPAWLDESIYAASALPTSPAVQERSIEESGGAMQRGS